MCYAPTSKQLSFFKFSRAHTSLISGDVRGRHAALFGKVDALNKSHGPFAALFCVGQFFGAENQHDELAEFVGGAGVVPIPTYFVCAEEPQCAALNTALGAGTHTLCKNLHYLGT